jgi:hypothetical protein
MFENYLLSTPEICYVLTKSLLEVGIDDIQITLLAIEEKFNELLNGGNVGDVNASRLLDRLLMTCQGVGCGTKR